MKKILLSLMLALGAISYSQAQFTVTADNPTFESWNSNGTPFQWQLLGGNTARLDSLKFRQTQNGVLDSFYIKPVHGDYYAALFGSSTSPGYLYQAKVWPGPDSVHFFNATLSFFPQLQNEATILQAVMYKHHTATDTSDHVKRDTVAISQILLTSYTAPWSTVSSPFTFKMHGVFPDSVGIFIASSIGNPSRQFSPNTILLLNNIQFSDTNYNVLDTSKVIRYKRKTGLAEANSQNVNTGVFAFPNPTNATTTLYYTLPTAAQVKLSVYDMAGREVSTLVNGQQSAGKQMATFDGSALNEGVYMYRLQTGSQVQTGKIVLSK